MNADPTYPFIAGTPTGVQNPGKSRAVQLFEGPLGCPGMGIELGGIRREGIHGRWAIPVRTAELTGRCRDRYNQDEEGRKEETPDRGQARWGTRRDGVQSKGKH